MSTSPLHGQDDQIVIYRYLDLIAGDLEEGLVDRPPSKETTEFWLSITKIPRAPLDERLTGKFMVFVDVEELDETWAKVRDLVIRDELSYSAKTATMRPNPTALDDSKKVVLVWTANYQDLDDVARVAWVLFEKGVFKGPVLNYKTDEATTGGLYAKTGSKKVSIYSLGIKSFHINHSLERLTAFFKSKYQGPIHQKP